MQITSWIRWLGCLLIVLAVPAFAKTYEVPSNGTQIVGRPTYITTVAGDSLAAIAQRYDLGINEISDANPQISGTGVLPAGVQVNIPAQYILPQLTRNGIVINLPEMRMYYFTNDGIVRTYPIGIGRVGKTIPIKRTSVVRKVKDPVWIPPDDIRAFNENQGIILPHVMPAGPDNPLGPYAIYLRIPTYLIHSTIFPESVGRRASFGCIRMHEADIKEFFPIVSHGTPVIIVDMPTKVGWDGDQLFMESFAALEEHSTEWPVTYPGMVATVDAAAGERMPFVDWQLVSYLTDQRDGKPHNIGFIN